MFQRSESRPGNRLGASTGWILRAKLKTRGVNITRGCRYLHIDSSGLHYQVGAEIQVARVDAVVICAGQEPERALSGALAESGRRFSVIGGARAATELDATRAISEGTRLGLTL